MKILRSMESREKLEMAAAVVILLAMLAVVGWFGLQGDLIPRDLQLQEAICLVLEKHVPNRQPMMLGGECLILVGVEDRAYMSIEDYAEKIRGNE